MKKRVITERYKISSKLNKKDDNNFREGKKEKKD